MFVLRNKKTALALIRFHDLRHTFATMAIENGMDVKTLSGIIGHISAETTLNIYSHITDTMRVQASVKIDRKIGGTNAEMPEPKNEPSKTVSSENDGFFEPYKLKIRKSGTGCIYQVNENCGKGVFIRDCLAESARNSTSTPRREKNARRSSPR